MRFSRQEMETIINWNMAEEVAYIHTRMLSVMKHLENTLGVSPSAVHRDKSGRVYGKDYEIPKSYLRLPRRPKKINEKLRQEMAARLAKVRERGTTP